VIFFFRKESKVVSSLRLGSTARDPNTGHEIIGESNGTYWRIEHTKHYPAALTDRAAKSCGRAGRSRRVRTLDAGGRGTAGDARRHLVGRAGMRPRRRRATTPRLLACCGGRAACDFVSGEIEKGGCGGDVDGRPTKC